MECLKKQEIHQMERQILRIDQWISEQLFIALPDSSTSCILKESNHSDRLLSGNDQIIKVLLLVIMVSSMTRHSINGLCYLMANAT